MLIHLSCAESCEVESAAVVEIELRWLIDNGLRISGRSKAEPACRDATDRAAFQRERDIRQDLSFCGGECNSFRQADPQIRDGSRLQFVTCTRRDDAPRVER